MVHISTRIIAHRGASGYSPENTELSILTAHHSGADIIEFDIQSTLDGQIVLFHDRDLIRITGVSKTIGQLTMDEVSSLEAGLHFNRNYKGIHIPTLDTILAQYSNYDYILEIKQNYRHEEEMKLFIDKLLGILDEHSYKPQLGYISVRDFETYNLIKEVSDIRAGVMQKTREPKKFHELIKSNNVRIAQIRWKTYSKHLVMDLEDIVDEINAFPADDPQDWEILKDWRVDGIITNYPATLKAWLSL